MLLSVSTGGDWAVLDGGFEIVIVGGFAIVFTGGIHRNTQLSIPSSEAVGNMAISNRFSGRLCCDEERSSIKCSSLTSLVSYSEKGIAYTASSEITGNGNANQF